jgi:hypothetical protein
MRFIDYVNEALLVKAQELKNPENQICTGWVLISEWSDFEGTRYLMTDVSDNMNPWLAKGMLACAEDFSYDPDDEEEPNA